ncbi:MAG: MerR family transcriptional regulator [Phascolarctobacterium sp.]|nr:MerR family transcriptional regulator [Phascolarctobacterium sp.]MBQ7759862.1 MerR family transcriptional regulator [Acidaminococcaceae bacterium]MBQ7882981.1 MerR family transcriptional regulator [Phascolarctobacterium sp.]
MTNEEKQSYFTAGELANIFGISKQTLLYYDRMGLFSPAFISDNGYRHYSMHQYMDLEVILRLRALNISIALIKQYLGNRSKEDFVTILESKRKESEEIIRENQEILKIVNSFSGNISVEKQTPFNQPLLTWREERKLCATFTTDAFNAKDRVMLFTRHSEQTFRDNNVLDKTVGWIIDREAFLSHKPVRNTIAFFSYAPSKYEECCEIEEGSEIRTLPMSLYVEVYFKGTFYENAAIVSKNIEEFLKINSLLPVGEVYVLPIENHLLHNDPTRYINKIFLQVRKQQ